ncbi:C-type lectin domain family 2 member D-like [Gopherus flavomarginatus]|uniref:C-type lectin domain family 2 member D-like n=1 Tax=Gopherus flavomarginatus TaxID=286002 RepID=UPI0021CC11BD|nr:C-type lectin domain family 2 member D-like [Gopherus flavomarginatus]
MSFPIVQASGLLQIQRLPVLQRELPNQPSSIRKAQSPPPLIGNLQHRPRVCLSRSSPAVLGPCCPDGWVGYQGKCYYFSEAEGNWNNSQSHCSALGASLAGIDSEQEMAFLLRYKGKHQHWIGLWREQGLGQPWKWVNGTEFNKLFPITADGDCAYLNDENRVSSLRCTSERHWICTKPDAFTKAKEAAVEGGS